MKLSPEERIVLLLSQPFPSALVMQEVQSFLKNSWRHELRILGLSEDREAYIPIRLKSSEDLRIIRMHGLGGQMKADIALICS